MRILVGTYRGRLHVLDALRSIDQRQRRRHVVKGWFKDTLPTIPFFGGIAFVSLDADWYEPMTEALSAVYPHVNPGGVISIDDYYFLDGSAKAVHNFLSRNDCDERIEVLNGCGYLRKPG